MTGTDIPKNCVVSERDGIIENTHKVHAAVVDPDGKLLYSTGDPSRVTLIRSAAKPAQALAILETGCFEQFDFDDADLALMCSSHSSEDRHIQRARAMLTKIGAMEGILVCGGHPALSDEVNRSWIKNGFEPTGICNNCSGKHAGMLAGSMAIRAGTKGYHHPYHPMQQKVKEVVNKLCDSKTTAWALDGCHLPAPAVPLNKVALLFARLADAVDSGRSDARTLRLWRIFGAMANHPEMVGGDGRFCTILAQAYEGLLIGKLGADGCYGVAVRPNPGTDRAIGIAVKIEDGNIDILYEAVTEILHQLQIGTEKQRQHLSKFYQRERLNTAGVVVGRVYSTFKVHS